MFLFTPLTRFPAVPEEDDDEEVAHHRRRLQAASGSVGAPVPPLLPHEAGTRPGEEEETGWKKASGAFQDSTKFTSQTLLPIIMTGYPPTPKISWHPSHPD